MRFNRIKCYTMTNNILLQTEHKHSPRGNAQPLLWCHQHASSDLKWGTHIDSIYNKASFTLSFIRCRRDHYPSITRKSLVRSILEYRVIIWESGPISSVRHWQLSFIARKYPGCVSKLFLKGPGSGKLATMQQRRTELHQTFMFKVVDGLMPTIYPMHNSQPLSRKYVNFELANLMTL